MHDGRARYLVRPKIGRSGEQSGGRLAGWPPPYTGKELTCEEEGEEEKCGGKRTRMRQRKQSTRVCGMFRIKYIDEVRHNHIHISKE